MSAHANFSKKEGFQSIQTAGTVKSGWEQFQAFSPDLAILDVMLPDGEGYDLCKKSVKSREFQFYSYPPKQMKSIRY